jgi:hypothetical protein
MIYYNIFMSNDEELAKKVAEYQAAAKNNPNINMGMLMINALQSEHQNQVSSKAKKWAYLISISAPPVGLLFALKYFMFSDENDAREVAWTCTILTVITLAVVWFTTKLIFSGSGASIEQIQQIKPSDIIQFTQ